MLYLRFFYIFLGLLEVLLNILVEALTIRVSFQYYCILTGKHFSAQYSCILGLNLKKIGFEIGEEVKLWQDKFKRQTKLIFQTTFMRNEVHFQKQFYAVKYVFYCLNPSHRKNILSLLSFSASPAKNNWIPFKKCRNQ